MYILHQLFVDTQFTGTRIGNRRVSVEAAAGAVGGALRVGDCVPAGVGSTGAPDAAQAHGLLRHAAERWAGTGDELCWVDSLLGFLKFPDGELPRTLATYQAGWVNIQNL